MADSLEEYAGEKAGIMMRSPFPDWNQNNIRNMVSEAGFEDIQVHLDIISMRYPSPEEFLRREAASSPLAEEIESMEPQMRKKLVTYLKHSLEVYTDDRGGGFPDGDQHDYCSEIIVASFLTVNSEKRFYDETVFPFTLRLLLA